MAGWGKAFDVPITLPRGKRIVTLDDARKYLLKIPKKKWTPTVGAAIKAVMMAANGEGPMMHANVGVGRVVYGPKPPPEPRPSKQKWTKVKLLRDR